MSVNKREVISKHFLLKPTVQYNIAEARENLSKLLEDAKSSNLVLSRYGSPLGVLMSYEQFEEIKLQILNFLFDKMKISEQEIIHSLSHGISKPLEEKKIEKLINDNIKKVRRKQKHKRSA